MTIQYNITHMSVIYHNILQNTTIYLKAPQSTTKHHKAPQRYFKITQKCDIVPQKRVFYHKM